MPLDELVGEVLKSGKVEGVCWSVTDDCEGNVAGGFGYGNHSSSNMMQ